MFADEKQVYPDSIRLSMVNLSVVVSNLLEAVFKQAPDIVLVLPDSATNTVKGTLSTNQVDVILVGLSKDQNAGSAIHPLEILRERNSNTRFLVLIEKPTYAQTIAIFRAGASGIIVGEELTFELLCKSVRCIHKGHVWANNEVQRHLVASLGRRQAQNLTQSKGISLLTNRELEVLRLLADGLSNSELASALRLSEHTVKNHLFKIYEKLGVSNRMEAVLYFLTPPTLPNYDGQQSGIN